MQKYVEYGDYIHTNKYCPGHVLPHFVNHHERTQSLIVPSSDSNFVYLIPFFHIYWYAFEAIYLVSKVFFLEI